MDSVEIKADVELGGNDQMFNNLVGRDLMREYGLPAQVVMLCPLLVGTDGKEKMSQSLGNYISIIDSPNDMFGKAMSIPDEIIANWFELCTDVPMTEVRDLMAEGKNPRDAKIRLAREIVTLYHDSEAGAAAEQYFVETFSKRSQPVEAMDGEIPLELIKEGMVSLPGLIASLGMAKSSGAARDLLKAGAVSLDGEKADPAVVQAAVADLEGKILRVGRHQFRRLIIAKD
jgi:tyrosyl-tRNA synthetase